MFYRSNLIFLMVLAGDWLRSLINFYFLGINGTIFVLGVYFLIILERSSQMVSCAGSNNVNSASTLTLNIFDEQITKKNLFVLFYEAG